ncbi:MAG: hypothetical protein ACLSTO_07875 [Bilophila wadsworthia]
MLIVGSAQYPEPAPPQRVCQIVLQAGMTDAIIWLQGRIID